MNRLIQGFSLALQIVIVLWIGLTFTWWLGIALFGGFLFLLIGLQFYLSRQMSGDLGPQTSRLSVMQIWRAISQETINCYRVFYFNQIFRQNSAWPEPQSDTKKIPILFLHGFFCNRGLWVDFAAEFVAHGHPCEGITLEPAFGSITEYSRAIDYAIDALIAKTGASKIVLIGHSMGGLAARSYLQKFGTKKIAKVITLGTPHQGTWLARFGHGLNAKQMAPSSTWLSALAQHEEQSGVASLFTIILTWYDNIVFPQSGQTIPSAKLITVSGIGHISMLFNSEVKDIVIKELTLLRD